MLKMEINVNKRAYSISWRITAHATESHKHIKRKLNVAGLLKYICYTWLLLPPDIKELNFSEPFVLIFSSL